MSDSIKPNAWLVNGYAPIQIHLVKETEANIIVLNLHHGQRTLIPKNKVLTGVFDNQAAALLFAIGIQERRAKRAKLEADIQTNTLADMMADYKALIK